MDLLLAHGDDGSPVLGHAADPGTAAPVATPVSRRKERYLADQRGGFVSGLARAALATPGGPERAAEVYRNAGRAALSALLRHHAPEKGRAS